MGDGQNVPAPTGAFSIPRSAIFQRRASFCLVFVTVYLRDREGRRIDLRRAGCTVFGSQELRLYLILFPSFMAQRSDPSTVLLLALNFEYSMLQAVYLLWLF